MESLYMSSSAFYITTVHKFNWLCHSW